MTRKLISTVVAAALALSTMIATPAAAISTDEARALRIILGIAAVGLIIKEIEDNNNDRNRPTHSSRSRAIPVQCVFEVRTKRGWRDVVGQRCVERSGYRRDLPAACGFEIRGDHGRRTVYGVECLRDRGVRVEAARY